MQDKKPRYHNFSQFQLLLMIMISIISWALAFPFIKIGLETFSFINLTIVRFIVVCTAFLLIIFFKRKWFSKLHKKDIIPLFILGFFGVMVYHLGLNYGEQYISPGAASLIIATIPIFVLIFAAIFLKEKITFLKAIGIIAAIFGVVIISIWGKQEAAIQIERTYAAIAVLISAIMGALYTIGSKKLLSRYNGLSLTTYAILLGSIGLLPLLNTSLFTEISAMKPVTLFAIMFLGLLSTVTAYTVWCMVLELKTASEISIYLYAIPVISTIASFILFRDEITAFFILGGMFVILGLYLVNKKNKKIQ